MKTLGKLNINSEKVLKNDELKSLKGGWWGECWIYFNTRPGCELEYWGGSSQSAAQTECDFAHNPEAHCQCG